MRKSIMTLAIFELLVLSVPVFAHFSGPWAGTGTGSIPTSYGFPLDPWRDWSGTISADHSTFEGTWTDVTWVPGATSGTFKGSMVVLGPDVAVYKGYWYWEKKPGQKMGDFKMTFYWSNGVCYGEWHSFIPAGFSGAMTGDRW